MNKKTLTQNQAKHQLKRIFLETVKTERPQTTKQLIQLLQQRHDIPPEETTKLLIELENENLLNSQNPSRPHQHH
jgi:hypothetical protein